ncbi:uncharacterized protein F4812DRAFT_458801 [Daldinia caldariorum]|uniref:uncharacterized protein n=1 Tax=Daldinia caldariorum TaxID=326644 RepID=UPI0020079CB5|nr:uncharacterized protein F4812DRAFT_458801 [Daldinia caldariorum]KAI1468365.1 hypothetical protein F4812DRAFT_458801 [Daldinia caldariorum]
MRPGTRPKEIHTKHLTERERFRVRTLYYDASMSKKRIEEVTGYSISQIRTAIRAKSSAIPPRSGRPKKGNNNNKDQSTTDDASPGQVSEDSTLVPRDSSPPEEGVDAVAAAAAQPQPQYSGSGWGLNRLPPSLRRYIWHLVLTTPIPSPSPSTPLSYTWHITRLPHPPFLVASPFPEPWATTTTSTSTHWRATYLAHRQPAARLLCHTCRESRRAVLDAFVPVFSDAVGLPMLGSPVRFLWVDLRNDRFYYKEQEDGNQDQDQGHNNGNGNRAAATPTTTAAAAASLPVLLDKSRAAVLPDLGRLLASTSNAADDVDVATPDRNGGYARR